MPGIEAVTKFAKNEKIVMFLSHRLTDLETQYRNSERDCLVVVKCLTEIKWLAVNNLYKILIYLDHRALQDISPKITAKKKKSTPG